MARWLSWPARFWVSVQRSEHGCWEWTGSVNPNGYGNIWHDGRRRTASRVSFQLERGEIPGDLCVLHHCDNRRCVRPDHLFLGTPKDNTQDMVAKGRAAFTQRTNRPRGSAHHAHKLTEEQVREIRRQLVSGASKHRLAKLFGVSRPSIIAIERGHTWSHVA